MATELVDGVWHLDLGVVNAYLVEDGDELVLFDAGTPRSAGRIEDGLATAGYVPSDVDRVIVTHYDLDHVGALAKLSGLSAPVAMGEPDASHLAGEQSPPPWNHKGAFQRIAGLFLSRPELPIERVEDGDSVGTFTAYHTPGHTPGHLAYVSEERGVAVLGDLVSESDGRLQPSPWAISYDTGEVADSIRELARRAPAFAVGCPGHGDPIAERASDHLRGLAGL
jgi:glyoxylase-like metal-dependent hydrolase (beta-lactamase superfamily II)